MKKKYSVVVKIDKESIKFDDGSELYSSHEQDCCEHHYLSFEHLTLDDFDGLKFNLSNSDFFKKIDGYGIELIPVKGHSVKVPGYGSNNGYYSSNLELVLSDGESFRNFDISECQDITD